MLPAAGFSARIFSVQRSVGSQVELALDGTVVGSAHCCGVVQPFVGGTLSVGGHTNLGAPIGYSAWQGDIAEVLVYDRRLSASEFNAVGGYLEQKYGLDTVFQPVPEPATWGLMLVGLWAVRRRAFGAGDHRGATVAAAMGPSPSPSAVQGADRVPA